ncbi:SpoIIE family protein phosphatase [Streptomyces sp. NBRC 110028]|uniref:ATP-binding SpoIIE family protein phosphatase n=1 Tax=Streptomyces sp. NBRC 110028 TaxID=1621260 RepID=UPI001F2EBFDE|nr:SpoIIE family protein phosphatase [Streptomyces sp. NBRC 110028]
MDPVGRAHTWCDERLPLLSAVGAQLTDREVMEYALTQAVSELGGIAGAVHWSCGPAGSHELRLVLAGGLPRSVLREWEEIREGDPALAPARAVQDGAFVWMPALDGHGPDTGGARPYAYGRLPRATMVAAVPLFADGAPVGALSVFTGPGAPTAEQRGFLVKMADWASGRLSAFSPVAGRAHPWWQQQPVASGFRQALVAARVGSWEWDIRTGEMVWDAAGLTLLGIPEDYEHRIESWVGLIHPEDVPRVMAATQEALDGHGLYEAEYRVCRPDGTTGWVQSRAHLVLDGRGEPIRMIGRVWDTTESRIARESVGQALRFMSDAFLAVDREWRITFLNVEAERLVGPSVDVLGGPLWDGPAGLVPGLEARCRHAALDGTPTGFDLRWPTDGRWYHIRLVPGPDGLTAYLTDVTDTRNRAARREAAERSAAEQAARIRGLTSALAEAVTTDDVVRVAATHMLSPFAASGLLIQVLEAERLHVVGAVGYPQAFLHKIDGIAAADSHPLLHDVLASRQPRFISSAEEYVELAPGLAGYPALAEKNAWALLPLIASGEPNGVCVVAFTEPHGFSGDERTLLTTLSGMVAHALARARLYDAEHARAQALQRGLLPQDLPTPSAVTAAVRYLPASSGTEVGGDWYDIIPLSAERVALVIGDVMGHGLAEAATMGRLRTAVHTLANLELPPEEVLAHLNDIVGDLGDDSFATCLYAVYDPVSGVCSMARAGHPPPLLVRPDGTVECLDIEPDPPLGAAEPPFTTAELRLPGHSLLVLYTDGLVESATRDIDVGIAECSRVFATDLGHRLAVPGHPPPARGPGENHREERGRLDRLCDTLIDTMLPVQQLTADDTAVLVARLHRTAPENIAVWRLPDEPVAASLARDHVRGLLREWHLDELVMTTELLASELVGNVVRHAKGPVHLRLLRGRSLICEVSDGSATTPRIRRAAEMDEGGRGLQLVAALSQRWGTRYTADGKCIWTEQPIPPSDPERALDEGQST